ncbi:MAG: hypothetical protein OEY99_05030 [Aigarchaeota archaeon]|nr:hypothetical protein [Aigarchaeota archaeon]
MVEPNPDGYDAKYLGGHPAYTPEKDCRIFVKPEFVEISGELNLKIRYEKIKDIGTVSSQNTHLADLAGFGAFGLLPQHHKYMGLTIEDDGVGRTLVFEVKGWLWDEMDVTVHDHPVLQAHIYNCMTRVKRAIFLHRTELLSGQSIRPTSTVS